MALYGRGHMKSKIKTELFESCWESFGKVPSLETLETATTLKLFASVFENVLKG